MHFLEFNTNKITRIVFSLGGGGLASSTQHQYFEIYAYFYVHLLKSDDPIMTQNIMLKI